MDAAPGVDSSRPELGDTEDDRFLGDVVEDPIEFAVEAGGPELRLDPGHGFTQRRSQVNGVFLFVLEIFYDVLRVG